MTHTRRVVLALLPLLIILGSGCGGGNPQAPASVSGEVKYKGKPVPGGTVQFVTATGGTIAGSIAADGTYAVADIPVGEYVIAVETESVNPDRVGAKPTGKYASQYQSVSQQPPPDGRGGGTAEPEAPKYLKIPEKYSKGKTSPITYTVKAGRQVYSIELTD